MKQKILLILLGVLAIFLGIYLSSRGNKKTTITTSVSPTPRQSAGSPPVIIIPEAPTNVSFVTNTLTSAPISLPEYSYLPIFSSFSDASTIAQRLGFSEKPLQIKNGKTTTYQWTSGTNIFTLDSKENDAWLSFSQPAGASFSSSIVQTAEQGKDFFKNLYSQQEGQCALQPTRTSTGPFDGTISTDTLKAYYYACVTPNQSPIVSSSFQDSVASIVVNQNGVLRSFSLTSLFALIRAKDHTILTPEEALTHIKKDGGILISISRGGDMSFFDSAPQFNTVSVSSYSFIYYPNTQTQTLEPYYVFEGTATSGDKEILQVKYAFPARTKD